MIKIKTFDIAVIGGGPGGYAAAIRASKMGRTVALIEESHLGGTCLNRGCIPSKTLLRHGEVIEQIQKAAEWGIETGELSFSLERMMDRKNNVIQRLRSGISSLMMVNKIEVFNGTGTVNSDLTVEIETEEGLEKIVAKDIIIATGSVPTIPNIPGIDNANVYTSDSIFDITKLPKSLAIVGGGIIGVEFACIFANLNVEITIIELEDRIISTEDENASTELTKMLSTKNVNILTRHQVESMAMNGNEKEITLRNPEGEQKIESFDEVLVAVGRQPNMNGVKNLNLKTDGPYIHVSNKMETNVPNVYAIGDVIGGWQLAHVATAEGLVAAENAAKKTNETIDYRAVPRCVYTFPEVASVGYSKSEAKALGYSIKESTFPLQNNGKALAMDEANGFIKVIADEEYGEILGVVIVGANATEMISEATAFITLEGTVDELANMIHPHPTLSEGIFEAANDLIGQSIHM